MTRLLLHTPTSLPKYKPPIEVRQYLPPDFFPWEIEIHGLANPRQLQQHASVSQGRLTVRPKKQARPFFAKFATPLMAGDMVPPAAHDAPTREGNRMNGVPPKPLPTSKKGGGRNTCCSTVEQLCLTRRRLSMSRDEPKRAWQISQVQQLVGLSRRDIQRACYDGKGGADILDPQESSWGRRQYGPDDLAKLFIVRQYKRQGHSLPEIARIFDEAKNQGCDFHALLQIQTERLYEACENALDELVRIQALTLASTGASSLTFEQLVDFLARNCHDAPLHSAPNPTMTQHQSCGTLEATTGRGSTPGVSCSLKRLAQCMLDGIPADDILASSAARDVACAIEKFAHMPAFDISPSNEARPSKTESLDKTKDCTKSSGSEVNETCSSQPKTPFEAFLDMPGADLTIELWLGAGTYDYLCRAAAALREKRSQTGDF